MNTGAEDRVAAGLEQLKRGLARRRAVDQGAQDYLVKGATILGSMRYALERQRLEAARTRTRAIDDMIIPGAQLGRERGGERGVGWAIKIVRVAWISLV